MPIGIQRLNAKRSQPNPNIIFIKPLPGPSEKTAQAFLERIAAQCYPVMGKNHISVMTLEEYEPNREFVGRNFNAGEVVQLVLRSGRSGRWLPFEYVQMVMMHELAHCKQMNHSRGFWAVRNQYAAQMEELWREGYTGEGIWGRGASLATGEWERDAVRPGEEVLPEHLCGGTYRSRRRGRRRAAPLTYQERKRRRIVRKFGEKGVLLGADEEVKVKLEKGKTVVGRPRVAGSARGRELRAAAALARFEEQKGRGAEEEKEEDRGSTEVKREEEEEETDSGNEPGDGAEYEEGTPEDADSQDALDVDGTRMLDGNGRGMVKVCEDEDAMDEGEAKTERAQLRDMFNSQADAKRGTVHHRGMVSKSAPPPRPPPPPPTTTATTAAAAATTRLPIKDEPGEDGAGIEPTVFSSSSSSSTCSMCSFENDGAAATCSVCAHVLSPALARNTGRCGDSLCKRTGYVHSGDGGDCGLRGQRRRGAG